MRKTRSIRGAALVELILVTPAMVLLLVAGSEFGRALQQQHLLTTATRDGVRFAAATAASAVGIVIIDQTLATRTRNLVVYGNPDGSGASLLPGFTTATVTVTAADASHVIVQATYAYQPLFGHLPFLTGLETTMQMRSSAVMAAL